MTVRTRRMPPRPSAAHVRMAAAMFTPPPRNPAPDVDTAWRGTLDRHPDGALLGELQDLHGWTLTIVGTVQDRDTMTLRSWARTPGLILPAMDDRGLRSDLTDRLAASWPWTMARAADDAWRGEIAGPSWRLVVTGTRVSAGRMALAAVVEGLG
jgi:hypothetical protein